MVLLGADFGIRESVCSVSVGDACDVESAKTDECNIREGVLLHLHYVLGGTISYSILGTFLGFN